MIGELLLLVGALLTFLAALGMARFRDVFARMHALTKASTAGALLVLLGAAVSLDHPNDVTSLVLAAVLQLITSPVAANMVSRSTYGAEGIQLELDVLDELGRDMAARDAGSASVDDDPAVGGASPV